MFVPDEFSGDQEWMSRIIADFPLAMVIIAEPQLALIHLPLVLAEHRLLGHLARRNLHVGALQTGARVMVTFNGPDSYVSPRWYEERAGNVPTWNYAAVALTCRIERVDDPVGVRSILAAEVAQFDPQWSLPDAAQPNFVAALSEIVGLAFVPERVECKLKLSQNRSPEDRRRVIEALTWVPQRPSVRAWMEAFAREH